MLTMEPVRKILLKHLVSPLVGLGIALGLEWRTGEPASFLGSRLTLGAESGKSLQPCGVLSPVLLVALFKALSELRRLRHMSCDRYDDDDEGRSQRERELSRIE